MKTPDWAARIWFEGDRVYLELPYGKQNHTVSLPETDWFGVKSLLQSRGPFSRLGEQGDPTQWRLDIESGVKDFLAKGGQIKRKEKATYSVEQRAKVREVLRQLGMI